MEAFGSLNWPIPRPGPVFHQPRPVPRVAQSFLEAVLVELTRPRSGAFAVRIFDEGLKPPDDDVVATIVLYGTAVSEIGERLETAWAALRISAIRSVRYVCYRSYDHRGPFAAVLKTVEALQECYLP